MIFFCVIMGKNNYKMYIMELIFCVGYPVEQVSGNVEITYALHIDLCPRIPFHFSTSSFLSISLPSFYSPFYLISLFYINSRLLFHLQSLFFSVSHRTRIQRMISVKKKIIFILKDSNFSICVYKMCVRYKKIKKI